MNSKWTPCELLLKFSGRVRARARVRIRIRVRFRIRIIVRDMVRVSFKGAAKV